MMPKLLPEPMLTLSNKLQFNFKQKTLSENAKKNDPNLGFGIFEVWILKFYV